MAPQHHEGFRNLATLVIGQRYHRRIGYGGMAAQHCLELGGRYLEALVLDQLLQPIDDREVAVLICVTDVARVEPALLIEHGNPRMT